MVGGNKPPGHVSAQDVIVEECVRAILTSFELSGFRGGGYRVQGTIVHHKECIRQMGGDWLAFYKYKLAAWISYWQRQDLPPRPVGLPASDSPAVLLGGRAKEWIELVAKESPTRLEELIATVGTVKRAMPRPTAPQMREAAMKAFAKLTTRRPDAPLEEPGWDDPDFGKVGAPHPWDIEGLTDECRRVVREVFSVEKEGRPTGEYLQYTEEESLEPFFFSTNANYITTRSAGGAVGAVMRHERMDSLRALGAELVKLKAGGKSWRSSHVVVEDHSLLEKFRQLYEGLLEDAVDEPSTVKLVPLAEALKIRVISKGPVLTYTVLKPLQKWLWRTLRGHRSGVFKLIGEEIGATYLEDQVGQLRNGEMYLSGDYSDATNELDPRLSEAVVDEICKLCVQDRRIRTLFKRSLTGHEIENPDTAEKLPQKWGQLMGSIVSFPILCIVNAAICRRTREVDTGRRLTLRASGVAVNGDDCLFRATARGRKIWEDLARASGMKPSVGKYWFSDKFCNMNSAQFRINPPTPRPSDLKDEEEEKEPKMTFMELVPKVNMGLLVGLGRSTSGKVEKTRMASWGTVNSISNNANTLVKECAEEDRERVFKAYLNRNWDMLTSTTLPWFLPEHLGGLGLPTFPDYVVVEKGVEKRPWMPTKLDLKLAQRVYHEGKLPPKRPEGVMWKVWDHAQKRAAKFPKETVQASSEMVFETGPARDMPLQSIRYDNYMGKLCVEAIFVKTINQVYRENREENLTLRRTEKEVTRLLKGMTASNARPFDFDKLPSLVPREEARTALRQPAANYHSEVPLEALFRIDS